MSERKQQLVPDLVLQIRAQVEGGEGVQAVADKHGLSYFTVYQIRRGWTYRHVGGPVTGRSRGRMTPDKAERVRELRQKGATIAQLAKAAKVGKTTIKKALAGEI